MAGNKVGNVLTKAESGIREASRLARHLTNVTVSHSHALAEVPPEAVIVFLFVVVVAVPIDICIGEAQPDVLRNLSADRVGIDVFLIAIGKRSLGLFTANRRILGQLSFE